MLTRDQAQKLAEKVLKFSTFPECTVTVTSSERVYTRFANNGITTAAFTQSHVVEVDVSREARTGSTDSNDLDDASLRAAVKQAEELAAVAPPNPEHLPPLGPQTYPPAADFDPRTASARSPEMIPHVRAVIERVQARKLVAAGFIERIHTVSAVANKAGLFGFHEAADSALTATVRMPDGSSSGWAGHPSTRFAEIDSARVADAAIEKCLRWRNPRRLDPGNYMVVLEPAAAGDLVRLIGPGLNARATEEGRTFLSKPGGGTLLGEKLFPDFVTLRTDPRDGRVPGSPWTADLLPSRAVTWVDKGVVTNLFYNRYWAEKTGKQATVAPGNLIMDGSSTPLEDLIAGVERGLLVTHFFYIRFVNQQTLQQTGLTRDGLFLIENGKIAAPVTNFRFNESPVRLLKNAVRVGQSIRVRGLEGGITIAPPIVATDFPFTSLSDAI
jgi:predicted Zn-dependent protease